MKILYAAGEASPFAKTGGLADVAGSLPQALNRKGIDCRVVIPLYDVIPYDMRQNMRFISNFYIRTANRAQYCGIFESEHDGAVYYFIDNEGYFKRGAVFGEYDDAERFAFFSRAVLEMLPHIDFKPDIINANDWHTALIPIYKHVLYPNSRYYSDIKTIFTIHNIAFQGKYNFDIFDYVFGLPHEAGGLVEYDGYINLMKGAIEASHSVTAVSPNYVKEISGNHSDTSGYDFGWGLTPFINYKFSKFTGILNGVDMNSINPSSDNDIYRTYDINTVHEGKKENKLNLQEELGLEQNPEVPLIGIVTRIDNGQKGCELIIEALANGLLKKNDAQLVILGSAAKGDYAGRQMEDSFNYFAGLHKGKMAAYIGYDAKLAKKIYAASDIYLMPSRYEPCGLSQIMALKYGTVPVVRETGGLADTVTDNKHMEGNGFVFKNYSHKELISAVKRALSEYTNSESWHKLIERAMGCDYSWDSGSVNKYIDLYTSLIL